MGRLIRSGGALKVAAVSDLHGLKPRFVLLARLLDEGIDTLLVAGDVARGGYPEVQQADVRENFGLLLKGRRGARVLAIPGNDDWAVVEKTLREFPEVSVPTDRAFPLDAKLSVVGYPFVPVTPFLMKDYEKWDTPNEPALPSDRDALDRALVERGINISGLRSDGTALREFAFDLAERTENIAADMDRLATLANPRETLYLIHCPPVGYRDGGLSPQGSKPIGSRAVLDFVRKHGPLMTVHGHSHEAADRGGGEFRFRIGESTVLLVGPGNDPAVLNFLLLDPATGLCERRRLKA
jgi:Icc-related predicted phosphoesterase